MVSDSSPLIGVTARRLATGRVSGWHADGVGERVSYLARVRAAGGLPVVLDPHTGDGDGDGDQLRAGVDALVARLDGVVLTGGPDVAPQRYGESPHETVYGTDDVVDAFELELARAAIGAHLPLLAICRGIQVLNVAYGGTLHQHIPERPGVAPHGRPGQADGQWVHSVALDPSSRLVAVMGTDTAVCSCHHHQAIDRVGDGLRIVAARHRRDHRGRRTARRVDRVRRRGAVASRGHRAARPGATTPVRRAGHGRALDRPVLTAAHARDG